MSKESEEQGGFSSSTNQTAEDSPRPSGEMADGGSTTAGLGEGNGQTGPEAAMADGKLQNGKSECGKLQDGKWQDGGQYSGMGNGQLPVADGKLQNGKLQGEMRENGDGEFRKAELDRYMAEILALPPVKPWPEPVNLCELLEEIYGKIAGHVVLPKWGPEAATLWVPHTFAFQYRDITTYLGIESPEHRCGKSTLVTVLSKMTQRAVVSSNVSTPSLFRVVAQIQPTLFIDEADTFLIGNDELRGILNSSYHKETGFVLRAFNLPLQNQAAGDPEDSLAASPGPAAAGGGSNYNPGILRFSCWCPKLIARIGALPRTLADRCIVLRLHRKTPEEPCERLRKFKAGDVKSKCLRFVLDHAAEIAAAEPEIPRELNDRAADIWEPLFVIADLAGGPWPERARNAAIGIAAASTDSNPMAVLLFDIFLLFQLAKVERMFSYEVVRQLNEYSGRPWRDLRGGKPIDERWLARQLSPYGIRPRMMRINGVQARGYCSEEMLDVVRRYVPKPEGRRLIDELKELPEEGPPGPRDQGEGPEEKGDGT